MSSALFERQAGEMPSDDEIRRYAKISLDKNYRWWLSRRWESWRAGGEVCFIGLNPSTADHLVEDPTTRRWLHFANAWGYVGYVAVNLYPYRSSTPQDCRRWVEAKEFRPYKYPLKTNLDVIADEAGASAMTVACWGNNAWDQDWVEEVIARVLEKTGRPIYCFGTTSSGAPIHPMARGKHRIPDDAKPVIWREPATSPSIF